MQEINAWGAGGGDWRWGKRGERTFSRSVDNEN